MGIDWDKKKDRRNADMKRLMTVNLAPEQKSAVQDICSDIGAECVDIQRKHYGMKVGSLCDTADISGCGDETRQTEDLSMDMLIFDGVSSKELDIFLERYKKTGLPAVRLKSVVTRSNREWTVQQLYSELAKEYLFYRMRGM